MTSWIRFRSPDANIGFGVLANDRVMQYEGDMFGDARATGELKSEVVYGGVEAGS